MGELTLHKMEPAAKALAATAMSQTLSFCMERKYLENISDGDSVFELEVIPSSLDSTASWIEINQVGKPLENSAEYCFTAIQKILYSCFLPKEMQLLFLITGNKVRYKLYLGVRTPGKALPSKSTVKNLNEFIKGIWPGLQTTIVSESESTLQEFKNNVSSDKFEHVYSLTGIPSMESQYKSVYPATIDKLMAGMRNSELFAYLVVADPIENSDAESMLYQCREMNGQAESLKSMNITEGMSLGTSMSKGTSFSHSDSIAKSVSETINKRDFSKLGSAALKATGLGLAASVFPTAGAVLAGVSEATGQMIASAAGFFGGQLAVNTLNSLIPQKSTTEGTTTTSSDTKTESETFGTNESKSHSISRNIVNKHIEAISEHLFYHSKRIETGKAIGLWKVGTYLLSSKLNDIKSAGLQLRSILSGQESIFEPIRIHDISKLLDQNVLSNKNQTYKELTIGQFNSPTVIVNDNHGRRFEHPLGENYKELKTVLTTKELSYLINFPLRSVPGISVVDSSPEFSLNQQETKLEDANELIKFGKLLYGGSETKIPYNIYKKALSRHTLLSGINGTGKTNTVQAILNGIDGLPFLVIEPAKTEYVDWAIDYNKKHPKNPIDIYIPGCKKYKNGFTPKALKINPFEIVWLDSQQEPNVLAHIDRLKSTFAAAFPMYDILPILLEDLIYMVYQNKSTDWLNSEPVFGKTLSPTLNSMSVSVDKVISNRQYEERIERNMKACLNTRIDSLKRGWKGEMLNTIKSTPWKDLFAKPCVINLSYVGDDVDKSFFMALILQFLYEFQQACAEIGDVDFNDNSCRHLTIIEEAHRVMSKCENPEMPQYKTAMMFSNMLSEIRAYGEGMLLVDQVPTRLIPDAIKNTNLKITHRLVAEDDCKAIGESMGLSKEQRMIIPKLLTGQCVISSSLSSDTHWIIVDKVK